MAERIISGPESKGRCSRRKEVETPSPALLGHSQVNWGKISAYLAIFAWVGGAMWQFADVSISVRNLSDDVKDLKRESENLLRTSVETSFRVTVLERRNAQPALASSSTSRLPTTWAVSPAPPTPADDPKPRSRHRCHMP